MCKCECLPCKKGTCDQCLCKGCKCEGCNYFLPPITRLKNPCDMSLTF
jgi:hypothetical protein